MPAPAAATASPLHKGGWSCSKSCALAVFMAFAMASRLSLIRAFCSATRVCTERICAWAVWAALVESAMAASTVLDLLRDTLRRSGGFLCGIEGCLPGLGQLLELRDLRIHLIGPILQRFLGRAQAFGERPPRGLRTLQAGKRRIRAEKGLVFRNAFVDLVGQDGKIFADDLCDRVRGQSRFDRPVIAVTDCA